MGKTISAFFQFILEDPIMMGLCIAIVVLIILFILVLILGKRADIKDVKRDKKEEELLKTEVNLESLSINNVPPIEQPVLETFNKDEVVPEVRPEEAIPVPVTTEEPTKLEIPISESAPIEQFSVPSDVMISDTSVPSFEDFKIEAPTEEEIKEITQELDVVGGVNPTDNEVKNTFEPMPLESNSVEPAFSTIASEPSIDDYVLGNLTMEETPVVESNMFDEPNIFDKPMEYNSFEPIIESTVSPVDVPQEKNETLKFEDTLIRDAEPAPSVIPIIDKIDTVSQPVIEESTGDKNLVNETIYPNVEEVKEELVSEENLRDIYSFDDAELPEIKVEDFSRTAIIRHMPILETNTKNILDDKPVNASNEDLEDLDLPKLNTDNQNSTLLNALKGESFNIEK